MAQLDYQLNPVLMEGTVTKAAADDVALNLRGRLGVFTQHRLCSFTSSGKAGNSDSILVTCKS